MMPKGASAARSRGVLIVKKRNKIDSAIRCLEYICSVSLLRSRPLESLYRGYKLTTVLLQQKIDYRDIKHDFFSFKCVD